MIFVVVIAVAIFLLLRKGVTGAVGDTSNGSMVRESELPYEPSINLKFQWRILDKHKSAIMRFSSLYNVPMWVIVGLINTESGGNVNAEGSQGEVGLMQLYHAGAILDWRKRFGFVYSDDFFKNPTNNIQVGTWFLSEIHARTGANWLNTAIHVYQVGAAGYLRGRRSPDKSARVKRFTDAVLIPDYNDYIS